jgi:hypothetical protein
LKLKKLKSGTSTTKPRSFSSSSFSVFSKSDDKVIGFDTLLAAKEICDELSTDSTVTRDAAVN